MLPGRSIRRGVQNGVAIALLAGWILPTAAMAADGSQAEIEVLDTLALENNQRIHAFDTRAEAALLEAEFEERRWPEPVVEYMVDVSAPWAGHFTTGHMIRVMQRIPRGGARQRRGAPGRAAADVAQAKKDEELLDLLRDLRLDVVELARVDARLRLLDDEIGLIEDATAIVAEVAGLGRVDHAELLQLELAREAAVDRQSTMRSKEATKRAVMASRIGVERGELEEVEITAELLKDWSAEIPTREELIELARQYDPTLDRLDAEIAVAQARVELVNERNRPWPSVMAGYSNRPPMWDVDGPRSQMFQLGVSIPLPIFGSQYDPEAARWEAVQTAAEQERAQRVAEISGEVDELLDEWDSDLERLARHERELLPMADDLARQILIGVELGERSAAEFVLAVQQEVQVEGRIIELRADLLVKLVHLQRLTAGTIGTDQPWAYPADLGGLR